MGIYETYLETKKLLGKSFYDDVTCFFFYVNVIVRCRQEMALMKAQALRALASR
jgi:hypothetical protein